jgi:hypothetical protein
MYDRVYRSEVNAQAALDATRNAVDDNATVNCTTANDDIGRRRIRRRRVGSPLQKSVRFARFFKLRKLKLVAHGDAKVKCEVDEERKDPIWKAN